MKRWSIVVYRGERSSCMGFSVSDSFLTAGVVFLSLFFAFFAYLAVEGYRNRSMLSHMRKISLDAKDLKIIEILQENGRASYSEIARRPSREEMMEAYRYADELGIVYRPVS